MSKRDYDHLFKVSKCVHLAIVWFLTWDWLCSWYIQLVLIGDSGVGKSCLLLRFAVRVMDCCCVLSSSLTQITHYPLCLYLWHYFLSVMFVRMMHLQRVISVQLVLTSDSALSKWRRRQSSSRSGILRDRNVSVLLRVLTTEERMV